MAVLGVTAAADVEAGLQGITPDPQQCSLVGTHRLATTVIGTRGLSHWEWNPRTRQLKSDLTRPPVTLYCCAAVQSVLCPDMG